MGTPLSEPAIETRGLQKRFGRVEALRGMDLQVPRGSICGFLGRNGAGKTTTLKLLLGMLRPDAGEGRVLGLRIDDPHESLEIRRRTAFVSETKDLYPYMTVGQVIGFVRGLSPQWRADRERHYLQAFDLPTDRRVTRLSKGMRSKLMLLLALARGAEMLILDEPTDGLDPAAAEDALQALVGLTAEEGLTVFFSSHQLAEVEQVCDRVCILDQGRVVVQDSLDDLKTQYRRVHLVFEDETPLPVLAMAGMASAAPPGRAVSLLVSRDVDRVVAEARRLRATSVDVQPVTLKEIFLQTVRHGRA